MRSAVSGSFDFPTSHLATIEIGANSLKLLNISNRKINGVHSQFFIFQFFGFGFWNAPILTQEIELVDGVATPTPQNLGILRDSTH